MRRSLTKICFVELHASSLFLKSGHDSQIGGAEVQQYLLAQELIKRGKAISFILDDSLEAQETMIGGIQLLKSYGADEGFRFLRVLYPRLPRLWRALELANADLYYIRGARDISPIVGYFCRLKGRRMFHAIAHDYDCDLRTLRLKRVGRLRAAAYVHGLRLATNVLTQTETQRSVLRANFGIESEVVRNVMPLPQLPIPQPPHAIRRILWVGTLKPIKRPEMVLSLAARFPNLEFDMIGPRTRLEMDCHDRIVKEARNLPNLRYSPFVPFAEIDDRFRQADVVLMTSEGEGFPNVLLQAWAHGKPVVSTYDPDGLIAAKRLGTVASNEEECAAALEAMCNDSINANSMGRNARLHAEEFHSPGRIVDRLIALAET